MNLVKNVAFAAIFGIWFGTSTFAARLRTLQTTMRTAATINDHLQPALEDALGVDLLVESFFETSASGANSVSLLYVISGGVPDSAATVPGFTTVVEGLGGTVSFSMAAGSDANVTFDELKIADLSASGSVGLTENKIFVTIISTTTGP